MADPSRPPLEDLPVNATLRASLDRSQVIDLTTTGRRSGEPRRIEIFIHNLDGRLVISGMPVPGRTRAWLRNVADHPGVTLHYKAPRAVGDVEGTARIVTDPAERRELLEGVARNWGRDDVDVMVEHSPLMVVTVPGYPG
jgi:deazaflavin-dependent oxidoreductase (nitroreductase family)